MARFEVVGLDGDQGLIRSLARKLAEAGPDSDRLRGVLGKSISEAGPLRGGILRALRRSPLVGADVETTRRCDDGRPMDL